MQSPLRVGGDSNPITVEENPSGLGSSGVGTIPTVSSMMGGAASNAAHSPKVVTEEKLKCYEKFRALPIMVEGPEFTQDYSYFL